MNLRLDDARLAGVLRTLDQNPVMREDASGRRAFCKAGVPPERRYVYRDANGHERSVGIAAGRLVEVVAPPRWPGLSQALRLLRTDTPIEHWRLDLFRESGDLIVEAPSAAEPDDVVCECKGVTRSDIESLLPSCVDRIAIGKACGAGTVCGACLPRIDEIAGRGSTIEATLIEVHRLEVGIARFRFRPRSTETWALGPGAWISVQALVSGRWIARPYTVVAAGSDGCLDIIVKREPLGLFSRWLHDFATPDSSFRLSKPQTSRREPGGERVLFIAGGIGITPAFLEASLGHHRTLSIHWSLRDARTSQLAAVVGANMRLLNAALHIRDTTLDGRQEDWGTLYPPAAADTVVVCGPPGFQHGVTLDLRAAGWSDDRITIESFGPQRASASVIHHAESFDYRHEPVVAESFHLRPAHSVSDEAFAFLRQFYFEHGAPAAFTTRWEDVAASIAETGTYRQTFEELAFGARLAWRNAARCIGRFFWKSLQVRDCRHLETEEDVFAAIVAHLEGATCGGDIQPIITVFRPGAPCLRILNAQLILYAGYRKDDGSVLGDPRNVELTNLALELGWHGKGTRFDVLPVIIQTGASRPKAFTLPEDVVLEVDLTHPREPSFKQLGLRWFAVPAVSGMALDVGGIQYTAAPSNGFYMGTEIASQNLADPSRYDETARVAAVMGRDATGADPLWRDQAMLDLNVAVLHSFAKAGVRILDHHSLSTYFMKFREAERQSNRPSFGHWAWIMPPMGGNLSPIWRDNTLQKKILKPNYFYQSGSVAGCPLAHGSGIGTEGREPICGSLAHATRSKLKDGASDSAEKAVSVIGLPK